MSLPKYATKEEILLAIELGNPYLYSWFGPSQDQWMRLLRTTDKLYEILDSVQVQLRALEKKLEQDCPKEV